MRSVFKEYYTRRKFVDRYEKDKDKAVDVIIPVFNTNELWKRNLLSFYKEIPIHSLFIGDGGCDDNTLEILKEFPRVKIIDQTEYNSLGYCIKELIENTETEWFVYLHSDVLLPDKWFDTMAKHQFEYDWFECKQRLTTMVEYESQEHSNAERAYSGSQMGRKEAFDKILDKIDDDYLYRNEDIIFCEMVKKDGFKYGRVFDTFHYHQLINKNGEKEPKFNKVTVTRKEDEKWEKRMYDMQARGVIKYLHPKKYLADTVNRSLAELYRLNMLDWFYFKKWVRNINPVWLRYIKKKGTWKYRICRFGLKIYNWLEK